MVDVLNATERKTLLECVHFVIDGEKRQDEKIASERRSNVPPTQTMRSANAHPNGHREPKRRDEHGGKQRSIKRKLVDTKQSIVCGNMLSIASVPVVLSRTHSVEEN